MSSSQQEKEEVKNDNDPGFVRKLCQSHDYNEIICSICLDKIQNILHFCTKYECTHYFHNHCIRKWQTIGKNKCPYCQQMDYTMICLKITRIYKLADGYNRVIAVDKIYINKKAKLLELASQVALFCHTPPHIFTLKYFNPVEDGKEFTKHEIIYMNGINTLFPESINYNDLCIEECGIKDGAFVFATSYVYSN
jgi:hypothetical protein